ncbi:MAG TPA: site-specific integrase [Streptosporangiaceae bacterium]
MIKVVTMGFSRKRTGRDGKSRYTAYYLDIRGQERSAGTFSNKKDANDAWKNAEVGVKAGKQGDPGRGKQTFHVYVLEKWLPHHQLEPGVRSNYAGQIGKHLIPFFGPMKMRDILPEHVRQWVTYMKAKDASARTIQYCKGSILNAIFTTALEDEVVTIHPSRGVKTPPVPDKPRRIITAAQFDRLYQALPDADAQLLVETDIESGMRWGELTEVRVRDLDFTTCILTVSRAVVELSQADHPDGGRFLVKDYPKDKEYRRFKLSQQITGKIEAHVSANNLADDDLLFTYQAPEEPRSRPRDSAVAPPPGMTEPNEKGRQYRHGTLTAYNAARCRCEHCRGAYATYRAARRTTGKDEPRTPRARDTDGHIPADWFRSQVWHPACQAAGLASVRVHDMRHAHASWLLAGGADLQVVKERLGHASISTTEKYLHSLPTADETALDALARMRGPNLARPA